MRKAVVLLAEDDQSVRTVVTLALTRANYEVRSTNQASRLWQWVMEGQGDIVITDVNLPDGNGLDLIPRMAQKRPGLRIIAMSAQSTLLTALKASAKGAFDYLPKPFDVAALVKLVERGLVASKPATQDKNSAKNTDPWQIPLIGRSVAMQEVFRLIARLMNSDLPVLVTGEVGVGKTLVAHTLHDFSNCASGPFVTLNLSGLTAGQIEAQLFGTLHNGERVKGAFERANGGSLFLDKVAEMPMEGQARLLRVMQEGHFTPIGACESQACQMRILAASEHDLLQRVHKGLFREDFYYRLNVIALHVPALRERSEDIPDLARYFFSKAAAQKHFSKAALEVLKKHSWAGNVREFKNLIDKIILVYTQEIIEEDEIKLLLLQGKSDIKEVQENSLSKSVEKHLKLYFHNHKKALPAAGLYHRLLNEFERPLIEATLRACRGNQIKTAALLGLNRNTLRKKIHDLGIEIKSIKH